jgi:hypothetical protein
MPGMPTIPANPPTPLEVATDRLSLYLKAERAILDGNQAYEINGRRLTRADLQVVADTIATLRAEINLLTASTSVRGRFAYLRLGRSR